MEWLCICTCTFSRGTCFCAKLDVERVACKAANVGLLQAELLHLSVVVKESALSVAGGAVVAMDLFVLPALRTMATLMKGWCPAAAETSLRPLLMAHLCCCSMAMSQLQPRPSARRLPPNRSPLANKLQKPIALLRIKRRQPTGQVTSFESFNTLLCLLLCLLSRRFHFSRSFLSLDAAATAANIFNRLASARSLPTFTSRKDRRGIVTLGHFMDASASSASAFANLCAVPGRIRYQLVLPEFPL